jgi:hypothetical protein
LGFKNENFWAKLHLCSTERQETAGSSVFHNEKTFVLQFCKILSADGHASASKVEKKAKKVEILQWFGDF